MKSSSNLEGQELVGCNLKLQKGISTVQASRTNLIEISKVQKYDPKVYSEKNDKKNKKDEQNEEYEEDEDVESEEGNVLNKSDIDEGKNREIVTARATPTKSNTLTKKHISTNRRDRLQSPSISSSNYFS